MKYKKSVDWDALTPEELEALNSGDKTEEELISDWEKAEQEEREAEKARLAEEAAKAKELADNYKIRAEKAERRTPEESTPKTGLSQTDMILLARAEIHEDDIEEVLEYAKYKKIPVKDALKSTVIRSILAERNEERKTSDATAVGSKRQGSKPSSGSELLSDAIAGKVPQSDDEIERLAEARFRSKTRRN